MIGLRARDFRAEALRKNCVMAFNHQLKLEAIEKAVVAWVGLGMKILEIQDSRLFEIQD